MTEPDATTASGLRTSDKFPFLYLRRTTLATDHVDETVSTEIVLFRIETEQFLRGLCGAFGRFAAD